MIKYGIGIASGMALALVAAIGPGSASLASPDRPGGATRPAARGGAPAAAPVAWVANQSVRSARKGSVTPIDTATNAIIKKIPVSRNAIGVALTPDGKTATGAVGKAIVFRGSPGTMALTPDGKTLYVMNTGGVSPQDVIPINTVTKTVGRAIGTGLEPTAIAISGSQQHQ